MRLYGRDLSLGSPEHLFHNLKINDPLELEFGFADQSLLARLHDIVDDTVAGFLQLATYAYIVSDNPKNKDLTIQRQITSNRKLIEPFVKSEQRPRRYTVNYINSLLDLIAPMKAIISTISTTTVGLIGQTLYSNILNIGLIDDELPLATTSKVDPNSISEVELERVLRVCLALKNIVGDKFSVRLWIGLKVDDQLNNLFLNAISAKSGGKTLFEVIFSETRVRSISSELIDRKYVDRNQANLARFINVYGSIFNLVNINVPSRNRFGLTDLIAANLPCVPSKTPGYGRRNNDRAYWTVKSLSEAVLFSRSKLQCAIW